jgi:transposase-like protein
MSEAQVEVAVSRRRSREEADRLVLEYEQSGQTRRVFCRAHDISPASLDNYRKRRACIASAEAVEQNRSLIERDQSSTRRTASALVPVDVIESPSITLTVTLHEANLFVELSRGRRIGVVSGFDATTLTRLIAVLERA